jgi:hypothetical protein
MAGNGVKFGIDGGVGLDPENFGPVTYTIGIAVETDTARPVTSDTAFRFTRMGIDGGITVDDPKFEGKPQTIGVAVETDTARPVVDASVRAGTIMPAIEADTAHPLTFSQSLGITLVSSSRGTNIITANETLTVNVTDSTGINLVTVNGVAASFIQIITPTEITCVVPLGVGADYFSHVDVIVDNGELSQPFSVAEWQPPFGMNETHFTVPYINLDPDSPFAGDSNFAILESGDSCIYDAVTTPGGNSVSMNGLGEFTIGGTITAIQTFDYYIYDFSDKTVSPAIEQITVHPGPVEVPIGQAVETDTALAMTSDVVVTQQIGQAVETDTALPVADGSIPSQQIGQAQETDTGHPVSIGANIQIISIGQAVETDTAFPVAPVQAVSQQIGQAVETDTAFPVIDAQSVSQQIGQAFETDTAHEVSFPATLDELRDQVEALQAKVDALCLTVEAQGLQLDELYIRFDLDPNNPNTYADDGSSISNPAYTLTKSDNGDGTFDIAKT